MKRVLSVLLALVMLCGVGAVGVSAGGSRARDPELLEARGQYVIYAYTVNTLYSFFREEFTGGLLPGKELNDFIDAYKAISRGAVYATFDDSIIYNEDTVATGITLLDALLAEYLTSTFIAQVKRCKDAYIQYEIANNALWWNISTRWEDFYFYLEGKEEYFFLPYEEFWSDLDALKQYYYTSDGVRYWDDNLTTIAQFTTVLQVLGTALATINNKVNGETEPIVPPALEWVEKLPEWLGWIADLPAWLQWVCHYVLFGWIWDII